MKVLVDTSVWSAVLRRKHPDAHSVAALTKIIDTEEVFVAGIIVQELLSCIKDRKLFDQIRDVITDVGYVEPVVEDYVAAASMSAMLQAKGITATTIDLLIAAVAIRRSMPVLTSDKDFRRIAEHSGLKVIEP
jgi:predicted nucleic acid-binding protein